MTRLIAKWMPLVMVAALAWPGLAFAQDTLWNTWRQGGLQALHDLVMTILFRPTADYGIEFLAMLYACCIGGEKGIVSQIWLFDNIC